MNMIQLSAPLLAVLCASLLQVGTAAAAVPRNLEHLEFRAIPQDPITPVRPGNKEIPQVIPGLEPVDDADGNQRVTPVVKAVRRAADSVVSIYVSAAERNSSRLRPGQGQDGQGSGVILDEKGLVITNWHVVAAAEGQDNMAIRVKLKNGKQYDADLLSTSASDDLGLLQLRLPAGERVKPVVLGSSKDLEPGETLIAIGNPQGHANTVTVGVLSATEREITVRTPPSGQPRTYQGLLQTDAAINQGNSGGALLDITGRLIGINNAMAFGVENIGFAIPVDTVTRVFRDKLLASESLASLWLGLRVQDQEGLAVLAEVDPEGPAHAAGLRAGDQLVLAGGRPVQTALDFARGILDARPGVRFPLEVRRGARTIRAEPVPISVQELAISRSLGLTVTALGLQDDRGLIETATRRFYDGSGLRRLAPLPVVLRVDDVRKGSSAAEVGLQVGDHLIGLRQNMGFSGSRNLPLQSLQWFAELLGQVTGRELGILVLREGRVLEGEIRVR